MEWGGRRVLVIGLARQGKALVRYLSARGARLVVNDRRTAAELASDIQDLEDVPVTYVLGGHPPDLVEGVDLVCLSGGVPIDLPIVQQARQLDIPLTNDSQLFLEVCPAQVIGITGSAGKTTTTLLAGRMAEIEQSRLGRQAWIGGNIGNPLLDEVEAIREQDLVVMELSSFQLELIERSPEVAAILNITPNHLDRHKTMQAYRGAKSRILAFQAEESTAVLGKDDPGAWGLRSEVRGRLMAFSAAELAGSQEGAYLTPDEIILKQAGQETAICRRGDIRLRGEHNALNVAAACAAVAAAGIGTQAMRQAATTFEQVAHRLEFVRQVHGVDYYNDSIATTPQRAIAAMRSFDEPLILLAGGRDKDLPWEPFADLACERLKALVLFGEAAGLIEQAIGRVAGCRARLAVLRVATLDEAVAAAARLARPGAVILLAPGATSFDEYADFEARGRHFHELVHAL